MSRVPLEKKVLSENDRIAADLRERFREKHVLVVNLISSPGSGKTSLLEKTFEAFTCGGWRPRLSGRADLDRETARGENGPLRVAVLTGDIQTENDANRLKRFGFPAKQITTGGTCHLDARMIHKHLADWRLDELDLLFIENVGNLVCPSSYDLGEAAKIVLLSVTEGEDKPLKYPTIFNSADVAVITKWDLAVPVDFDEAAAMRNIQAVRPGMKVFKASAKTGEGMAEFLNFLESRRTRSRTAAVSAD